MSLSLPRLRRAVAKASVPQSHGCVTTAQRARLARRIAAVARAPGRRRASLKNLRPAMWQMPGLPAQVRQQDEGSRATPAAMEALRCWLRAAAAVGLLSTDDIAGLRGATPRQAFAVLRAALARQATALCAPIAEAIGDTAERHPAFPVALQVCPLLGLDDALSSGLDTALDGQFLLRLVGQEVGLVEWRLCETTEDRAIRGALDALSKVTPAPSVMPCDMGAQAIGCMYVEFATDAVQDARKVDGEWVIDPQAVRNFADELGWDDEADAVQRLQQFAEFKDREKQCAPLAPDSPVVQAWLAAHDNAGTRLVRRLIALAEVARTAASTEDFTQDWEGSIGPVVGLCIMPDGFDDWFYDASNSFYEEDQHIVQTFSDPVQLLRVLPSTIVAVALANATCSLLVGYLNDDR